MLAYLQTTINSSYSQKIDNTIYVYIFINHCHLRKTTNTGMVLGPNINASNSDKFLDSMENETSYEKIVFHIFKLLSRRITLSPIVHILI